MRNRRFTADEDKIIKVLRENGVNSVSIANAMGRSKSAVVQRALKLGISFEKNKKELSKESQDLLKNLKGRNNNKAWETISTNIVINKLVANDIRVFKPAIHNVEEDLLIYKNNKFFKVQVKCASLIDKYSTNINWQLSGANFYHREKGTNSNSTNYKYPNIDFIIVNCMATNYTYVIPNDNLKFREKVVLRFYPEIIRYYKDKDLQIDTDVWFENYEAIQ